MYSTEAGQREESTLKVLTSSPASFPARLERKEFGMERSERRQGRLTVVAGMFFAVTLIAALMLSAASRPGVSDAASPAWRPCAKVVVDFQPEGGGGAIAIKARGIRCRPARKVVRRCINGKLTRGWKGVYHNNRFILRRRTMRIRYLPVGGGGCIPV